MPLPSQIFLRNAIDNHSAVYKNNFPAMLEKILGERGLKQKENAIEHRLPPTKEDKNMESLADLSRKDLSGYSICVWYRLKFPTDPGEAQDIRYYNDKEVAQIAGMVVDRDTQDLVPEEVYVLTGDNKVGYLISGQASRILTTTEDMKLAALEKIKSQLSQAQIKRLKLLLPG